MMTENNGWVKSLERIAPTQTIEDRLADSERKRTDFKLIQASVAKQREHMTLADSAMEGFKGSTSLSTQRNALQAISSETNLLRRETTVVRTLVNLHNV